MLMLNLMFMCPSRVIIKLDSVIELYIILHVYVCIAPGFWGGGVNDKSKGIRFCVTLMFRWHSYIIQTMSIWGKQTWFLWIIH